MPHISNNARDDCRTDMNVDEPAGGYDDQRLDINSPQRGHTYNDMVENSKQPLYPDCTKYSKLAYLIILYHIKCLGGWNNNAFNMLKLLKESYPMKNTIPKSFYETEKLIGALSL